MLYRHTKSSKQGLGHHDDSEAKIDPSTLRLEQCWRHIGACLGLSKVKGCIALVGY